MNKISSTISKAMLVTALLLPAASCDNPNDAPQEPQVISQKITMKKAQPEPVNQQTASTAIGTVQTADLQPKSVIAKVIPTSGNETDATATAPTQSMELTPVVKQLLASKNTYTYNPAGKIDPFALFFEVKAPEAKAPEQKKEKKRVPLTPLERIDLSQLKLKAIILAPSGNKALVEDPSGKGYVIQKGTYIGTKSGKVAEIQRASLLVAEEAKDSYGKIITKNREMKIQKPAGEM
jgi:type IV pilus assembly protein PilP